MDQSEQEAIDNLNDMSSMWLDDCYEVNLRNLSNNLISQSQTTQNSMSRDKQSSKEKKKRNSSFNRPMSQQRNQNMTNPIKRHSLSINQDPSFMYDIQSQTQKTQQKKAFNYSLNGSLTQLSGQVDSNITHNIFCQSRSQMMGSKLSHQSQKIQGQSSVKAIEFLNNLMAPNYQQNKKDHFELLTRLRQKERISLENHQELALYGYNSQMNSQQQLELNANSKISENNYSNHINETNLQTLSQEISSTTQNSNDQQYQLNQLNNSQISQSNILYEEQLTTNKLFNSSTNSIQRVQEKMQERRNSSFVTSSSQNNGISIQNNPYQQQPKSSFRQVDLVENSPQFLIKLKSRFSRPTSCYRKKTPLKNINNNNTNNINYNGAQQQKEKPGINIPNPNNIYTSKSNFAQNENSKSSSDLQFLKIIPTPQSVETKIHSQRRISSSYSTNTNQMISDDYSIQKTNQKNEESKIFEQYGKNDSIDQTPTNYTQILQNQTQSVGKKKENKNQNSMINTQSTNAINFSQAVDIERSEQINQSARQLDNLSSKQSMNESSQIKMLGIPVHSEVAKINLSSQFQQNANQKQNKQPEDYLCSMQVMGRQIKQNIKVLKPQSCKQIKESYSQETSRQQMSLSLYGESFNNMNNKVNSNKTNNNDDNINQVENDLPLQQKSENIITNNLNYSSVLTSRKQNIQKENRILSATSRNNKNHIKNTPMQQQQQQNTPIQQQSQQNNSSIKKQQILTFNSTYQNQNQKLQNPFHIHNNNNNCQINSNNILKIDCKMMQGRNMIANENENPFLVNTTKIFDDEALCEKVNNILNLEMSSRSSKSQKNGMENSIKKCGKQLQTNTEIKINVNNKTNRTNVRSRQNSVDLSSNSNTDLNKNNLLKRKASILQY